MPLESMFTQLLLEGVPECLCKGSFILSTKHGQGMTQATTAVSQSRPSSPSSLPWCLKLVCRGGQKVQAYVRWGRLASKRAIAPWTMCLLCAPLSPKLNVLERSSSLAVWTSGKPWLNFVTPDLACGGWVGIDRTPAAMPAEHVCPRQRLCAHTGRLHGLLSVHHGCRTGVPSQPSH